MKKKEKKNNLNINFMDLKIFELEDWNTKQNDSREKANKNNEIHKRCSKGLEKQNEYRKDQLHMNTEKYANDW